MAPMSSPTLSIALPDTLRAYVAERVASGQYGNTSEYMRDLIRKDQQAQRHARLHALLEDGLTSGPAEPLTPAFWDELTAVASGAQE